MLLQRTLLAFYQWKLDKEVVAIFSTKCLNFTTNRSGICDNCFELTTNFQLNDTIKTVSIENIDLFVIIYILN